MGFRSASRSAKIIVAATGISLLGAASVLIHYSLSAEGAPSLPHSVTIVRVPPTPGEQRAALAQEAAALFARQGKQNRADFGDATVASTLSDVTAAGPESTDKPQVVTAAMTPMVIGSISHMTPDTILGQDVNRGLKADRLSLPQMAVAKLLTPAEEPDLGSAGASAALFFVSPPPSSPAEAPAIAAPQAPAVLAAADTDAPSVVAATAVRPPEGSQATWADLVKLARVKGGDGEEKEPSIFGGLTEKEFRARELRCMATAVYFEARGEITKGQIAVAQVIMTRVRSDFYPNTICGVVYQGQWNKNSCQFSFACDGVADTPKDKVQWEAALQVAKNVMSGKVYLDEVGGATHYHATYVSPEWRKMVKRVTKIGVHIFYKAPFVQPLVASSELNQL